MTINLVADTKTYEAFQQRMLDEMIVAIRNGLVRAGVVEQSTLSEATWNIAFDVSSIIDGSLVIAHGGERIIPVLTFATATTYTELLHAQGGSWLHESIDEDAVNAICASREA